MLGNSLQNKKIIISAGASGIGWATAKVCLSRGATVYLCDIDNKSISKLNKHPLKNKKLFAYECDASDEYEVSNFFDQIKKKTKKIDALINNVGVAGTTGVIEKLNSEDWERTLKINVISHFYFTKLAIPMLKKNKGGSIINLSSGAGIMGFPLRSPYAASKWAVIGVTKTLAMELGKFKIRVNAICPGTIQSPSLDQRLTDIGDYKKARKEFVARQPMGRIGEAEEIANLALYLASDASAYTTGQFHIIDGGMCI